MQEIRSPFSVLTNDKMLTAYEELSKAISFLENTEYEAVQLYVQLSELINQRKKCT